MVKPFYNIGRDLLQAHVAWLASGRQGKGRIELENVDMEGCALDVTNLTAAIFRSVDMHQANFQYATLNEILLREVDAAGAAFRSVHMHDARIERGVYRHTNCALTQLDRIVIVGADFSGSSFVNSLWTDARVDATLFERARFGNASLNGTEFKECGFRGATFAEIMPRSMATTRGARFVDCNLRETDWHGRDLNRATFIRCKLEGAKGRPVSTGYLTMEDCDVTPETLGWR